MAGEEKYELPSEQVSAAKDQNHTFLLKRHLSTEEQPTFTFHRVALLDKRTERSQACAGPDHDDWCGWSQRKAKSRLANVNRHLRRPRAVDWNKTEPQKASNIRQLVKIWKEEVVLERGNEFQSNGLPWSLSSCSQRVATPAPLRPMRVVYSW